MLSYGRRHNSGPVSCSPAVGLDTIEAFIRASLPIGPDSLFSSRATVRSSYHTTLDPEVPMLGSQRNIVTSAVC